MPSSSAVVLGTRVFWLLWPMPALPKRMASPLTVHAIHKIKIWIPRPTCLRTGSCSETFFFGGVCSSCTGLRTPPETPVARTRTRRATPVRRRSALKARAPIAEAICTPQTPQYLASMDTRSSSIVAPSSDGKGAMLFSRAHLRSPSSGMLESKPRSFNVLRAYRCVDIGRRASWSNGSLRERAAGMMSQKSGAVAQQQLSPWAPLPRSPTRSKSSGPTATGVDRNETCVPSPNGRGARTGKPLGSRSSAAQLLKATDAAGADSGTVYKLRSMATEGGRDSDQETARSSSREVSPSSTPIVVTRGETHEAARSDRRGGNQGRGGEAEDASLSSLGVNATPSGGGTGSASGTPRRRFRRTLSKGIMDSSAISAVEFAEKMAVLASDVSGTETRRGTSKPRGGHYRDRELGTRAGASSYAVHGTSA